MLQELKAVTAARAAGLGAPGKIPTLRGNNFGRRELNPWAVNPKDALEVGGPSRGTGNLYFGVCDFEEHYKGRGEFDCLAQVTGFRSMNTGNWRFVYQKFSHGANHQIGAYYFTRGEILCLFCKAN